MRRRKNKELVPITEVFNDMIKYERNNIIRVNKAELSEMTEKISGIQRQLDELRSYINQIQTVNKGKVSYHIVFKYDNGEEMRSTRAKFDSYQKAEIEANYIQCLFNKCQYGIERKGGKRGAIIAGWDIVAEEI